jgi:hypothetical protein
MLVPSKWRCLVHHQRVTQAVGRREENTGGSLEGKVELLQHHAHHAPLDENKIYSKLSGRRVKCFVAQHVIFSPPAKQLQRYSVHAL